MLTEREPFTGHVTGQADDPTRLGAAVGVPELDTVYEWLLAEARRLLGDSRFTFGWYSVYERDGCYYVVDTHDGQQEVTGSTYRMLRAALAFCHAQRRLGVAYDPDPTLRFAGPLVEGDRADRICRTQDEIRDALSDESESVHDQRKAELLQAAATKPVKRVLQIDGFANAVADCVMQPDDDGDCIHWAADYQLSRCLGREMPVRVLVHEDADPVDVRRILAKLANRTPDEIAAAMPAAHDAFEREHPAF